MKTLSMLLIVGCFAMGAAGQDAASDTPEQAFETFRTALTTNDREAFMASFEGEEIPKEFMGALFDQSQARVALGAKVTDVFGEDAVDQLGLNADPFDRIRELDMDTLTCTQDGNVATCTAPTLADGQMVSVDGVWKISLAAYSSDAEMFAPVIADAKAWAAAYEALLDEVEAEGMTIDVLRELLDEQGDAVEVAVDAAEEIELADRGDFPVAQTPEEAVTNLKAGMLADDRDAVAACFALKESQMDAFDATVDFVEVAAVFDAKVTEVFGDEGEALLAIRGMWVEFGEVDIADCTFAEEGDAATCTAPSGNEYALVKRDGAWLFGVGKEAMSLDAEELEAAVGMLEMRAAAMASMMDDLDEEGMTLDIFVERVSERMVEAPAGDDDVVPEAEGLAEDADPDLALKQAVKNYQAALRSGDHEAIRASFVLDESQVELFNAVLDLAGALGALDARVTAVFGEEGSQEFGVHNPFQESTDVKVEECTFRVEGDAATCTMPSGEEHELVRIDGEWLFSETQKDLPTDEAELTAALMMTQGWQVAIEGTLDEVDVEGMTVESLKWTLEKQLREASSADAGN